jgi:hypothetical protein
MLRLTLKSGKTAGRWERLFFYGSPLQFLHISKPATSESFETIVGSPQRSHGFEGSIFIF